MKFGIRTPSLKKRFAARTSWKRVVRHSMGLKAPRGLGIITNPKKALYNKVYNKTSVSIDRLLKPSKRSSPSNQSSVVGVPKGIEIQGTGNIIRSSSRALTVTSKNFEELRKQITDIYNQRAELGKRLSSEKLKLFLLTSTHFVSYLIIVGFFYKGISEARKTKQKVVKDLEEKLVDTFVKLTFADKSQLEKSWLNCIDAFEELIKSEKIWDLTYAEGVDRAKVRTVAETATKRTQVTDTKREIEFVKSDLQYIFLPNSNGPDLFFYLTFLILFKDNQEFGIFDLKDIKADMKLTGYIEEESVPKDTEIIQYTYKKANKDGSMDKRFKGNYQIPIVKYGSLTLTSETGLEEQYMFSNFDAFTEFAKVFEYHIGLLGKIK